MEFTQPVGRRKSKKVESNESSGVKESNNLHRRNARLSTLTGVEVTHSISCVSLEAINLTSLKYPIRGTAIKLVENGWCVVMDMSILEGLKCSKIIKGWKKRWYPPESCRSYPPESRGWKRWSGRRWAGIATWR